MSITRTTGSRAVTRAATLLSTLLLVAVGTLVAMPTTATAAAGLECGTATLADRSSVPRSGIMTHSCVGSGTVQYRIDCRLGRDLQFSVTYQAPGKSIRRTVTCSSGYPAAVYWDIK